MSVRQELEFCCSVTAGPPGFTRLSCNCLSQALGVRCQHWVCVCSMHADCGSVVLSVVVPQHVLFVAVGEEGAGCWLGRKLRSYRTSFIFPLVLSMLHNPLGNVLGKPPLSFLPLDPLGSDVDKFSAPSVRGSRLDTRPILDSRSSSPSDSDTSGFSSGSDHLSDLIVCRLSGSRVGGPAHLTGVRAH